MFGVFQEYYSTHEVLKGSKGDLATVGTTSTVRYLRRRFLIVHELIRDRVFCIFFHQSSSLF